MNVIQLEVMYSTIEGFGSHSYCCAVAVSSIFSNIFPTLFLKLPVSYSAVKKFLEVFWAAMHS